MAAHVTIPRERVPQTVNRRPVIAITPNLGVSLGLPDWYVVCYSGGKDNELVVWHVWRNEDGTLMAENGWYTHDVRRALARMNERAGVTV